MSKSEGLAWMRRQLCLSTPQFPDGMVLRWKEKRTTYAAVHIGDLWYLTGTPGAHSTGHLVGRLAANQAREVMVVGRWDYVSKEA